jgi:Tol biopolymer transport system component
MSDRLILRKVLRITGFLVIFFLTISSCERNPLAVSPFSYRIAYMTWYEKPPPPYQNTSIRLYLLEDMMGSNQHLIREIEGLGFKIVWHPDGQQLLCGVFITGGSAIQLVSAKMNKRIYLSNREIHSLQLTPDGKQILFVEYSNPTVHSNICMINIDGNNKRNILNDLKRPSPKISPDGQKIAFILPDNDINRLAIMDIDGGNVTPLTSDTLDYYGPDWSPDGSKILFFSADFSENSDQGYFIYEYHLENSQIRKITDGLFATYSPDGRMILYTKITDHPPFSQQHVYTFGDSSFHWVFDDPDIHQWQWTPDNKIIVEQNLEEHTRNYFLILNVDGSIKFKLELMPYRPYTPTPFGIIQTGPNWNF